MTGFKVGGTVRIVSGFAEGTATKVIGLSGGGVMLEVDHGCRTWPDSILETVELCKPTNPYEPNEGGTQPDNVNHPSHYTANKYEVIDIIEEFFHDNFHLGNVFKYIARCDFKGNKLEDLKKARWYLDRYIQLEEQGGRCQ